MIKIKQATKQGLIAVDNGGVVDISFPGSKTRRGRVQDNGNISPTLTTSCALARINKDKDGYLIRNLTENEYYMLMGMTSDDCNKCKNVGISRNALFKTAGNGIVTNCVQLIFEHLYKAQYDNDFECTDERILQEQEDGELFS